jgi:hypothetical protein
MKKLIFCMGMVMASMVMSVSSYAQTNESSNGEVRKDNAKCVTTTDAPVMKVIERKGTTSAAGTTADGEVVSVSKTNFSNQSASWYSEVRQGHRTAYDPRMRDLVGNPRSEVSVSLGAGGLYRVKDEAFQPFGTLTAAYTVRNFIFEAFGGGTWLKYPDGSKVEDEGYLSSFFGAGVGYKVWQSDSYNDFLAVVAHGSYQHHKTGKQKDGEPYYKFSANDGVGFDAAIRYAHNLNKNFRLEVEVGAGRQAGNLTGYTENKDTYDVSQSWKVWDVRGQIKLAWRIPVN